ncbi:calcium/sodium antiporter [Candidatus Woesearchaeota archaeon]|nr:calcium/sodium antiporter [Candidatus Woesearchaeota archaeon]
MFMLGIWGVSLVLSLVVLIKASDIFTDSAETVGTWLRLPAFIIGVTIVAIGTSLPELASSIASVLKGSSEIVIGNVVGSNIANIFLVLGMAAIVAKKLEITYELIHVDLPLLISSAGLLAITVWDGIFSIPEAILCLVALGIYITFTIRSEKSGKDKKIGKEMKPEMKRLKRRAKLKTTTWLVLVLSAFFIYIGAEFTVSSVIELSSILGIGKEVIAASAVALGTSLPELVVSITAAKKGKPEIAVGNVLGSNIFNALAVMGIPALIGVLVIPKSILAFSLPVMLFATFLYFFTTQDRQITRWEGYMLVLFYVLYIGKLLGWM